MSDAKLQRLNMVESQIRPSDVTDRRLLKAMLEVPREKFVPPALASMAYMDESLAVGPANGSGGRYLLAPRTFAKLVQLAEVGPKAVVLDVGCATGYSTAVLATLAQRVVAVESDRQLADHARRMLGEVGADNATVIDGRLVAGAPAEGPFDVILLNGAVEAVAPALLEQLKEGGRLVAVQIEGPVYRAQIWCRVGSSFDSRRSFEAGASLLPGFEAARGFVF